MVDPFTTPTDNEGIMASSAKNTTDNTDVTPADDAATSADTAPTTQTEDVTVGTAQAESAQATDGQVQAYFVPEYNVSVEASSSDEAAEKAKELKGAN